MYFSLMCSHAFFVNIVTRSNCFKFTIEWILEYFKRNDEILLIKKKYAFSFFNCCICRIIFLINLLGILNSVTLLIFYNNTLNYILQRGK